MSVAQCDRGIRRAGSMGHMWVACLVTATGVAGCVTENQKQVRLVDLVDDDYVGGTQVVKIELTASRPVLRAELFLDGLRVAADELAPFALSWDTRGFEDGRHRLTARAYLDDNTPIEDAVTIQIDNTPPIVGVVTSRATRGESFAIAATDNGKIDHVEVSGGVVGQPPLILTFAPYQFAWPWCGPVSLEVRVVDAAGGETVGTFLVTSDDLQDQDCDGHKGLAFGGDDCNDLDATI